MLQAEGVIAATTIPSTELPAPGRGPAAAPSASPEAGGNGRFDMNSLAGIGEQTVFNLIDTLGSIIAALSQNPHSPFKEAVVAGVQVSPLPLSPHLKTDNTTDDATKEEKERWDDGRKASAVVGPIAPEATAVPHHGTPASEAAIAEAPTNVATTPSIQPLEASESGDKPAADDGVKVEGPHKDADTNPLFLVDIEPPVEEAPPPPRHTDSGVPLRPHVPPPRTSPPEAKAAGLLRSEAYGAAAPVADPGRHRGAEHVETAPGRTFHHSQVRGAHSFPFHPADGGTEAAEAAGRGAMSRPPSLYNDGSAYEPRAAYLSKDGRNFIVSLEPEGLGKLNIHLHLQNGSLNVNINVHHDATRVLLQSNIQHILRSLQEEGLNVGGLNVTLHDGRFGGEWESPGERPRSEGAVAFPTERGAATAVLAASRMWSFHTAAEGIVSIFV